MPERNGRQHFVKADHFINAECTSAAGLKKRAAILEKDIIAFSMRSMCSNLSDTVHHRLTLMMYLDCSFVAVGS